jgi:hypothetical protein
MHSPRVAGLGLLVAGYFALSARAEPCSRDHTYPNLKSEISGLGLLVLLWSSLSQVGRRSFGPLTAQASAPSRLPARAKAAQP